MPSTSSRATASLTVRRRTARRIQRAAGDTITGLPFYAASAITTERRYTPHVAGKMSIAQTGAGYRQRRSHYGSTAHFARRISAAAASAGGRKVLHYQREKAAAIAQRSDICFLRLRDAMGDTLRDALPGRMIFRRLR